MRASFMARLKLSSRALRRKYSPPSQGSVKARCAVQIGQLRNQSWTSLKFSLPAGLSSCSRCRFGPRRHDAVHAGVGDRLAHVFVGVHDDAQVHAIDSDGLAVDADLALKITRLQVSARGGYRIQRTL